jgi:hypothetical protein
MPKKPKFGKMELKENSLKSGIYLATQNFICIVIVGKQKK